MRGLSSRSSSKILGDEIQEHFPHFVSATRMEHGIKWKRQLRWWDWRSRRVGRNHINPSPCSAYCSSIRIFQIHTCFEKGIYRIIRHSFTNITPTSLQACDEVCYVQTISLPTPNVHNLTSLVIIARSKWRSDRNTIRV